MSNICDSCKRSENIVGVASSSLGPISFQWCSICLQMGAEPKWVLEFQIEECGKDQFWDGYTYFEDGEYKEANEIHRQKFP